MNAQLKQMLRDKRVTLSVELEPSEYLEKLMAQIQEDIKSRKNVSKLMIKKEALNYLDEL